MQSFVNAVVTCVVCERYTLIPGSTWWVEWTTPMGRAGGCPAVVDDFGNLVEAQTR